MRPNGNILEPIAAFVGSRLQHECPEINGRGNPWVSTIKVAQYKSKFDWVCVYCQLANKTLVENKWCWLKSNQDWLKKLPSHYFYSGDISAEHPTKEFVISCLKHDAKYYRKVYMQMVELQPGLHKNICDHADYKELLEATFEIFEDKLDRACVEKEQIKLICEKYHVDDINQLKTFMCEIYGHGTGIRNMMDIMA